jgi:cytochrome P450
MIADPALWADPVPFYEELRAAGPLVPCRIGFRTADYALTNEMLRSDDFHAMPVGSTLPRPLRWVERHTRGGQVRPAQPPSVLVVEAPQHTRYRKLVSSVFTPKALAALRDRVVQIAAEMLDAMPDSCPNQLRSNLRRRRGEGSRIRQLA